MTPEDFHQHIQSLAGEVQGHDVTFDGIHWTCTVGVEMQVDTPSGEIYEEHEAEFSGRMDDDPGEHLAEVWDWVAAAHIKRRDTEQAQADDHAELVANRRKYGAEY